MRGLEGGYGGEPRTRRRAGGGDRLCVTGVTHVRVCSETGVAIWSAARERRTTRTRAPAGQNGRHTGVALTSRQWRWGSRLRTTGACYPYLKLKCTPAFGSALLANARSDKSKRPLKGTSVERLWLQPEETVRGWRAVIAVDVGSCFIRLATAGRGVVCEQPALVAGRVAGRQRRFQPLAAGHDAWVAERQLAEGWEVRRPVGAEGIGDVRLTAWLLRRLLYRCGLRFLFWQPTAVVAIDGDADAPANSTLVATLRRAGFGAVYCVPSAVAAALGAGANPLDRYGLAVVHLGAHLCVVSVLVAATVQHTASMAIGGAAYTRAVRHAVTALTGLSITDAEAEAIKCALGQVESGAELELLGVERDSGLPRRRRVRCAALRAAVGELNRLVAAFVRGTLEDLPVSLATEVAQGGIVLCGGAATTWGLQEAVAEATGLHTLRAERPEQAVIKGLTFCLAHPELWNRRLSVRRAA